MNVDEEKLRPSEPEVLDDSIESSNYSKDQDRTVDWYQMTRSSYESSLNNSSESRENRHSEQRDGEDDVDGSEMVDADLKFVPVHSADVSFSCDIIQYEERDPSTVKPPVITDKKNPWSNGVQSDVTENGAEDCDDKFLDDCATLKNILRDEEEIINTANDTYLLLSTSNVG